MTQLTDPIDSSCGIHAEGRSDYRMLSVVGLSGSGGLYVGLEPIHPQRCLWSASDHARDKRPDRRDGTAHGAQEACPDMSADQNGPPLFKRTFPPLLQCMIVWVQARIG